MLLKLGRPQPLLFTHHRCVYVCEFSMFYAKEREDTQKVVENGPLVVG